MQKRSFIPMGILLILLGAAVPVFSSEQPAAPGGKPDGRQEPASTATMILTVLDPRSSATMTFPLTSTIESDRAVAVVNNEPITVYDLRESIVSIHEEKNEGKKEGGQPAPKIDFMELLQRLINAELIIQEARTMGLDELPAVQGPTDIFRRVTLRGLLREEIVKDVKADDAAVEKKYRELVREVRTSTAFFLKEEDAKKAAGVIKAGKDFDKVIAEGKKTGSVKGTEEGKFMRAMELNPGIAAALSTMKIGSVSPVTKIALGGNKKYFAIVRFDEERYVESSEAREQARRTVLETKRSEVMEKFVTSLEKKYAKTNKKLLKSLDYGPNGPGLEKLLADQRVITEIKGGKPVTVAQLSADMREKFFHGMKKLKGPKMITTRDSTLEEIVQKRVLDQEALRRGMEKTDTFKIMFKEFERNTLFGAFIEKVVVQGVKMNEEDLLAYYREHAGKYKSGVAMTLGQLIFAQKADALSALDKLRKGADSSWIKANAEGQVRDLSREAVLLDDRPMYLDHLPLDVQAALAGAQAGEFRLYESEGGTFHILSVKDVIPSQQQGFEEVRGQVRTAVFEIKLNAAVQEWVRKLKESADIKIYLSRSAQ